MLFRERKFKFLFNKIEKIFKLYFKKVVVLEKGNKIREVKF